MECSFEGCERQAASRGLCHAHYKQQHAGKPLTPLNSTRGELPKTHPDAQVGDACRFEGCHRLLSERGGRAQGVCNSHYGQLLRGEELQPIAERSPRGAQKACTFPGCGRKNASKGLCAGHALQRKQGKELTPLRDMRKKSAMTQDLPCEFIGCERTQYSKGLCTGHYELQRLGKPLRPLRTSRDAEPKKPKAPKPAKVPVVKPIVKPKPRGLPEEDDEEFLGKIDSMRDAFKDL